MRTILLCKMAALLAGVGLVAGTAVTSATPAVAASFSVSVSVRGISVRIGQPISISGKVTPRPARRYVYLQKRLDGSTTWRTVKRVKTTSTGAFTARTAAANDTDRYYRILKPKSTSRKAGRSASVQVIVDPASSPGMSPTLDAVTPSSGPLAGGTTLTLAGTGLTEVTRVTFTPQLDRADTADGSGVLTELPGELSVVDGKLQVVTPASLGGSHLVTAYTPTATLTAGFTYLAAAHLPSSFEQQLFNQINERRTAAQTCHRDGENLPMPAVPALTLDQILSDLALSHSRDLATRQDLYDGLSHLTWGTSSFAVRFRRAGVTTGGYGEILALSPDSYSAAAVVDQWMSSTTGHCESLMSAGWTRAGVGVAAMTTSSNPQNVIFSNVNFR